MKYLKEKDNRRRLLFFNKERSMLIFKVLSKDKRLSYGLKIFLKLKKNQFKRNFSKSRIVNRCVISGRGRGVLRYFRMSRMFVRQYYLNGILYGIRKASW